jgi:hypothetical protein
MNPSRTRAFEQSVEQSLVRIVDDTGQTLGTGFVIDRGVVLTCHHVVSSRTGLRLVDAKEGEHDASDEREADLLPFDLALLRVDDLTAPPLPIDAVREAPERFWSKGFHYGKRGFTASIPVEGSISGRTSVDYPPYHLDDVWSLTGLPFDAGMSGAPVVDADFGVALGVVSTHVTGPASATGTAIRLERAAAASPRLRRLLESNRASIPQYGPYLNALGAHALCRRQTRSAVDALEARRIYLKDTYCQRQPALTALQEFYQSATRIMPIIGTAGVGKTSFLANIAQSEKQPAVLLRGLDIDEPDGIGELITRGLRDAQEEDAPATSAVLSEVLGGEGSPLLVLLDALNEAPLATGLMADKWIPATCSWLGRRDVRCVLTCRPEYWERIRHAFNLSLLYQASERSEQPVTLGDFSTQESNEAAERYGVPAPLLEEHALLRHPLMLRMHVESTAARGEPGTAVRRAAMIERFLESKCVLIANRLPNAPPPRLVRSALSAIGGTVLAARSNEMPESQFQQVLNGDAPLGWELVREHLLEETGGRVRFTFDEVSEYLQADHVDITIFSDPAALRELGRGRHACPLTVAVHVLLRADAAKRPGTLPLITGAARMATAELWGLRVVLSGFFAEVETPARYLDAIEALLKDVGHSKLDLFQALGMLSRTQLDTVTRLRLLCSLLPSENGYGLRDKDRTRGNFDLKHAEVSVASSIGAIAERDPAIAIAELMTWLNDETPLEGGEGSVGSVAGLVIAWLRDKWQPSTLDHLARTPGWRPGDLLNELSEAEPEFLADAWRRWLAEGNSVAEDRLAASAMRVCNSNRQLGTQLLEELFAASRDSAVKVGVAGVLLKWGNGSPEVWAPLEQAFMARAIDLAPLASALKDRFSSVMGLIKARLAQGIDTPKSISLADLGDHIGTLSEERETVALVSSLLPKHPSAGYEMGSLMERKLNRLPPRAAIDAGYVELAERIAREGPRDAKICLMYFAGGQPDRPDYEPISRRIRWALAESIEPSDSVGKLVEQIIRNAPEKELESLLEALLSRLGADELESALVSALLTERRAERIRPWLAQRLSTLSNLGAGIATSLASGHSVRDATLAAITKRIEMESSGP